MMYRGPGYIYVCKRHLREDLPPTTDEGQCPYCKGGNLYGKYHKHRSGKKWWFNLQLEAAQKYVDQYPIEPYWDSYDGLCQEHVEMLLYGGEEGRMRVYDDLWEGAGEYTWAEGDAIMQEAIKDLDLGFDTETMRDYGIYPPTNIDLVRMARHTRAYLTIRLPVEHIIHWEDYDDVAEELEFFGINPADMAVFWPQIEWPNIEGRTPLLSPKSIAEGWINAFYPGYWYVMLNGADTLELVIKGELRDEMTLKKGACLILHDYVNGASSMNEYTIADFQVDTRELGDDNSMYTGIQRCCGFVDSTWNGVLE